MVKILKTLIGTLCTKTSSTVVDSAFNCLKKAITDKAVYAVNINEHYLFNNKIIDKMTKCQSCLYRLDKHDHVGFRNNNDKSAMFMYKDTPIRYSFLLIPQSDKNGNIIPEWRTSPKVWLSTINTKHHIDNLNEFLERCSNVIIDTDNKNNDHFKSITSDGHVTFNDKKQIKMMDDIFIPIEQKNDIMNAIQKFIDRKDWYTKHKLPYHYGITLYGEVGTGKSSIAQAIANEFNMKTGMITGDSVLSLPIYFDQLAGDSNDKLQVIIVEDIDCGKAITARDIFPCNDNNGESRPVANLATVLNSLDGLAAPTNIVYIFTTNHIEKLDPALIRPGRIDKMYHIGYVKFEAFKQFVQHYYDTTLDEEFELVDKLTIAELQNYVMLGYTLIELINKVRVTNTTTANTTDIIIPSEQKNDTEQVDQVVVDNKIADTSAKKKRPYTKRKKKEVEE